MLMRDERQTDLWANKQTESAHAVGVDLMLFIFFFGLLSTWRNGGICNVEIFISNVQHQRRCI